MQNLKVIIISLLILITIYTAVSKPVLHKHFIMVPEKFKLTGINQAPEDYQSTTLFKLNDIKISAATTETLTDSDKIDTDTQKVEYETKIIPSSLATKTNTNSQYYTTYAEAEDQRIALSNQISSEAMRKSREAELARKREEERQRAREERRISNKPADRSGLNRQRPAQSQNNPNDILSMLDNIVIGEGSCPVCDTLKNRRAAMDEETIAWNVWRSRIQNKIMDTANVDGPYGTIFNFAFDVDYRGNISNIRANSRYPEMNPEIVNAIKKLEHTEILKFPEKTKRKTTRFTGAFMLATYTQYSSPSDYNDFERIIRTNP